MRIGITKFPGTNNELDVIRALNDLGVKGELIYPEQKKIAEEMDALILAGGFSYGDYLRPGVIASHSKIGQYLPDYANSGRFVIGICNGFQILCEKKVLPGILTTNTSTKFISKWVSIKVQKTKSPLLEAFEDKVLKIPIAHFEGRYYDEPQEIENLQNRNLIAFRYCDQKGKVSRRINPNGSVENIAGLVNEEGNVLGMMPHPERASFDYLGSADGRIIFEKLLEEIKC